MINKGASGIWERATTALTSLSEVWGSCVNLRMDESAQNDHGERELAFVSSLELLSETRRHSSETRGHSLQHVPTHNGLTKVWRTGGWSGEQSCSDVTHDHSKR